MKTLKIGVIGCGAIAQVQHMPNLIDLHDLFDVKIVCDLSPGAAEYVATKFNVPQFSLLFALECSDQVCPRGDFP